jgi:hypothetical protein
MFPNPMVSAAWLGALIALASLSMAPTVTVALAGDMTPVPRTSTNPEIGPNLDGQVFSGEFGPIGKAAMGSDSWVFGEGTFLSKSCLECGFPESPYRVRVTDDAAVFETETLCPRTDATIEWRGKVSNGKIEGVFTWVRKRWYWTIEKQFWFRGTLVQERPRESTAARH